MHLKLGEPYEKFIQNEIKAGLYSNATELVRDALRHMHDDNERRRIEHIHALIAVGEEQIKTGKTVRYHSNLLNQITQEALVEAKIGKPIKDEIKPRS